MSEVQVLEIGRQAIQVALMVAMPMLGISLLIGVSISLFQVATSLQDITLTFVPKIVAVGLTLVIAGGWMLRVLLDFTGNLLTSIPDFVR